MADAPTEPYVGTEIGGYRIEERIGRGGMGVVYRAQHLRLGRRAAIKIIAPDLGETTGFRERFEREARIAASLHHPNVVTVYDAGETDDRLWLAMQLIEGPDLASILQAETWLSLPRALHICGQIAAALDAAHAVGMVHRDVKPANVLVAGDHAYLSDFGLTKLGTGGSMMTRAGDMVGSLHYCAPEQIEGREVDARADVYALGSLLYHCLAGDVPYPKDSDVAVIYAHLQEPAPRLSHARPDLPPELDALIARAMEKSPDRRFQSCGALMDAAREVAERAGPLPDRVPAVARRVVPVGGDEPDRGTVLGRVVATVGDPSSVGTIVDRAAGPATGAGSARVLLAGLLPGARAVARVALGDRVEVQDADTSAEAVPAAREQRPDVVVLDWNAEAGAGRDALRGLRGDAITRDVKVLLLVDWERADRGEVAAAAADATLGTPFSPLQLQVQFRKLLGRDALLG